MTTLPTNEDLLEQINAEILSVNELFGMWKDRDDIDDASEYVRKVRKPRKLC